MRVNEKGKKINDKFERRGSNDITRSLEQKYGLRTAEKLSKERNPELKMVDVSLGNMYEHLTNAVQHQDSAQFTQQQQPLPSQETQPIHRTEQYLESSSIGDSIGSLFDIPILPNGDDPEEEMFRRRMQRKKKKGRWM